jgi:hypothetical protein
MRNSKNILSSYPSCIRLRDFAALTLANLEVEILTAKLGCVPRAKIERVVGSAKNVVGARFLIVSGAFIPIWIIISVLLKRWGLQIGLKKGKNIIGGKEKPKRVDKLSVRFGCEKLRWLIDSQIYNGRRCQS